MATNRLLGLAAACSIPFVLWMGGCDSAQKSVPAAGTCDATLLQYIQLSGLAELQGARVTALAVVTQHEAGRSLSNRQVQTIDFPGNVIDAKAATGTGVWNATIPAGGEARVTGMTTFENSEAIAKTLRLLLHRLRGPLNLVGGTERIRSIQDVCILDQRLVRVAVEGDTRLAAAYYFDPVTKLLRYVTCGADKPGGEGTVTIYTWRRFPDGKVFPCSLKVVKIGQHVLIGEQPVLEADYSDVRVCH